MAFVPLNNPSIDVRHPVPAHVVARRKAMPILSASPVVSELLRDSSGGFILRPLDNVNEPVAEAQRWHTERKLVRKGVEDFGIEAVEIEEEQETGEWVPTGSTLPAGDEGLKVLHSLARRAGLLVVVFVRTLETPQSRAHLASLSLSLLPRIRHREGHILAITSSPLPSGGAVQLRAKLKEEGVDFPVVIDPSATIAKHYRVFVDATGIAHDGMVILQAVVPSREVAIGSTLSVSDEVEKELQVLYHYHAAPGSQTDEETDRGDPVQVHLEQRVPAPWQMVVRYGFANETFKKLPVKVSLRARNERIRLAQAAFVAKQKQTKQSSVKKDKHFDRYDPDFKDFWRREDELEEDASAKKYLVVVPRADTIWKLLIALFATAEKAQHLAKHSQQLTRSAIKRLARDWREVTLHPLPSITARPPFDNNILEWHADMIGPKTAGPYAGVKYHLVLEFPKDYPISPPTVRFRGSIHHAHVFGSYICLDMLTDIATEDGAAPVWRGWSSAYSVQSVLLQLQAFLFDGARQPRKIRNDVETYPEKQRDLDWNQTILTSIKQTRAFRCLCADVDNDGNQFVKEIQDQPVKHVHGGLDIIAAKRENMVVEKKVEEKESAPIVVASASSSPAIMRKSALVIPAPRVEQDEWTIVTTKPSKAIPKTSKAAAAKAKNSQQHPPSHAPGGPSVPHSRANSVSATTSAAPVVPGLRPLASFTPVDVASVVPQFDPWDPQISPDSLYRSSYFGKVMRLTASGLLVDLGLPRKQWAHCHVSQVRDEFTDDASAHFAVGDLVKARITRLEPELNRIACSFKGHFGKLITPIPSSEYPAKITTFTPEGGFRVSFHDGQQTHTGVVRNDSALTLAFNGVHFWSANEVAKIGQLIQVKLIDIEMQPKRAFIVSVVDATEVTQAHATLRDSSAVQLPSASSSAASSSHVLDHTSLDTRTGDPTTQLTCFHSKVDYRHDLLGLPLNLEYYQSGELSNVHAQTDLLSRAAFNDGVRRGVSRAPFTHWMPLYLDHQHAGDLKAHEEAIANICWKTKASEGRPVFHPLQVLKVLPALLNTIIVSMMHGHVHESIAALSTYTSTFQLLVAFTLKYPELQESADHRLTAFLESENGRSKKECPNLGELLALLTITSQYAWLDVAKSIISEVIDRNVKWTLLAYPELKTKIKEEEMEANAKSAVTKEGMKGVPKGVDKAEAERIAERRRITLVYQRTGKTPAQQAAEAKAAAATAVPVAPVAASSSSASSSSSSSSPSLGVLAATASDDDDGVLVDADDCDYPASSDEDTIRVAEAAAIAAEPEEVPQTKSEKKRFALLAQMDRGRLPKTFKSGRISYRLVLFHVHFLRIFRGIDRSSLVPLPSLYRRLASTQGRASNAVELSWQSAVKSLKLISTWRSFFEQIGLSVPTDEFMLGWLRQAIDNSLRRRYHSNRPPPLTAEQLAKREAQKKKREFESRLAEDGDHEDSGKVDLGDFAC